MTHPGAAERLTCTRNRVVRDLTPTPASQPSAGVIEAQEVTGTEFEDLLDKGFSVSQKIDFVGLIVSYLITCLAGESRAEPVLLRGATTNCRMRVFTWRRTPRGCA